VEPALLSTLVLIFQKVTFTKTRNLFISYANQRSCLGRGNRRVICANFVHARLWSSGVNSCARFIALDITPAQIQSSQVSSNGMWSDANRSGAFSFYDAVLCVYSYVCGIRCHLYLSFRMGIFAISDTEICYSSYNRVSWNNVCFNGLRSLPFWEEGNMVTSSRITCTLLPISIKYAYRKNLDEEERQ
jgi:hypothetical protein